MKITIIGSGNVASVLGTELFKCGYQINGVWSRTMSNAVILADKLQTYGTDRISDLPSDSNLYLIAVKDDAIEQVAINLNKEFSYNIFVVHTSGSFSSQKFEKHFNNYGVFYCLQTFTKDSFLNFKKIPILITASSAIFEKRLLSLAENISESVHLINEDQRKNIHLAAVFVNNFVNHMYTSAHEIMTHNNLDFKLLLPLIEETTSKILEGKDPAKIQTGPAIRNDIKIITQHLEMLEKYPLLSKIYMALSTNIKEYYQKD
jgi:predicted short-subunit dehydrogenase-like oxidoreductase (DUF2520 family)